MMEHLPQVETRFVIGIFVVIYVGYLLRRTISAKLDLYDLVLLSTVAIVPGAFAFFPRLTLQFSELIGVTFPFVVLFGILFFIIFLFLHRLTAQNHQLQQRTRAVVQELGLLREELRRRDDESVT